MMDARKGPPLVATLPWVLVCLFALALPFLPFFHPLLSPDSLHYADIARTFSRGEGLAMYHLNLGSRAVPDPFLYWPPLFPVLLAGGLKLGLGMEGAFRFVLALSLLLSFLGVSWTAGLLGGKRFGLLCGAAWLALFPFQKFWFHAWSEVPFTALAALALAFLARGSFRPSSPWWFLPAGIAGGLAALCRYPGIVVLPLAGLAILAAARVEKSALLSKRNLLRAALFLAPFLLLFLPWVFRNLALGGPFGPPRKPALEGALFYQAGGLLSVTLRLLYLPAALAGVLFILGRWGREDEKGWNKSVFLLLSGFLVFYGGLLLVLGGMIRFDRIGRRLGGPMLVSLLPLALAGGYVLSEKVWRKRPALSALPLVSLLPAVLWAGALFVRGFPLGGDKRMLSPRVAEWIRSHTRAGSLFVGPRSWWVPYQAGRPVLESGYPEQEPLTFEGVEAFLSRFPGRFPAVYLLVQEDLPEAVSLERAFEKKGRLGKTAIRTGRWRVRPLPVHSR